MVAVTRVVRHTVKYKRRGLFGAMSRLFSGGWLGPNYKKHRMLKRSRKIKLRRGRRR